MPDGWIILDKPLGLGSTQAVAAVKRNLRAAGFGKVKVGHGGTLDPLASGVLPIAWAKSVFRSMAASRDGGKLVPPTGAFKRRASRHAPGAAKLGAFFFGICLGVYRGLGHRCLLLESG